MFDEPARDAPLGAIEVWLAGQGLQVVVGVDEAGRGPLAGPVVAAAVALTHAAAASLVGLDDSKKLDADARERLAPEIRARAAACGVAVVGHDLIDEINILEATKVAWRQAFDACVAGLPGSPDALLVDGNLPLPGHRGAQWALVKGDARSLNIAAASVLAKTHRDALMVAYDAEFPGYGFARHKGYGTLAHRRALTRLGPCAIHRRSFRWRPVDG